MLAVRTDRDFLVAHGSRARSAGRHRSGARFVMLRRGLPVANAALALAGAAARLVLRGLALAARHPIEMLAGHVLCGIAGLIAWNALAVQMARHPAPLFGSSKPTRIERMMPLPPTRPAPEPIAGPAKPAPRDAAVRDPAGVPAPVAPPRPAAATSVPPAPSV